jgi:hypothetical protein
MLVLEENVRIERDSLIEELICLDEVAGELDDESNYKIDSHRKEILRKIELLEKNYEHRT